MKFTHLALLFLSSAASQELVAEASTETVVEAVVEDVEPTVVSAEEPAEATAESASETEASEEPTEATETTETAEAAAEVTPEISFDFENAEFQEAFSRMANQYRQNNLSPEEKNLRRSRGARHEQWMSNHEEFQKEVEDIVLQMVEESGDPLPLSEEARKQVCDQISALIKASLTEDQILDHVAMEGFWEDKKASMTDEQLAQFEERENAWKMSREERAAAWKEKKASMTESELEDYENGFMRKRRGSNKEKSSRQTQGKRSQSSKSSRSSKSQRSKKSEGGRGDKKGRKGERLQWMSEHSELKDDIQEAVKQMIEDSGESCPYSQELREQIRATIRQIVTSSLADQETSVDPQPEPEQAPEDTEVTVVEDEESEIPYQTNEEAEIPTPMIQNDGLLAKHQALTTEISELVKKMIKESGEEAPLSPELMETINKEIQALVDQSLTEEELAALKSQLAAMEAAQVLSSAAAEEQPAETNSWSLRTFLGGN